LDWIYIVPDILVNTIMKAEFYKIKGISPTVYLLIKPVLSFLLTADLAERMGVSQL
jgi:hypothetical protein